MARASSASATLPLLLLLLPSAAAFLKTSLSLTELTVGRVVVPTLARPDWSSPKAFRAAREDLFAQGLYPGVDYIIEARTADTVTVRPEYPLIKKLEREWPVTVDPTIAPRWMDPMAYNVLTAFFAVGLAISWLLLGLLLSQFLTISVINSASMVPTIQPGDAILVEKLTPRLGVRPSIDDLVFFEPPESLQAIVREREQAAAAEDRRMPSSTSPTPLSSSRLFVKRVAAVPGDEVSVAEGSGRVEISGTRTLEETRRLESLFERRRDLNEAGPPAGLLRPRASSKLKAGEYFVLGDNGAVSVDSRCWGELPAENIAGRPLVRVFPMSRVGVVK